MVDSLDMKHTTFLTLSLIIFAMSIDQTMSRSVPTLSMLERHEQWMTQYGRVYKTDEEKALRFKIFNDNVGLIEKFNEARNRPYKLGINAFADQTNEEFKAARNGLKAPRLVIGKFYETTLFRYENVSVVPPSMDWRQKGAVTPVKNQGQCGKSFSILKFGFQVPIFMLENI